MSFIKSLLLAIFATFFLTYVLGVSVSELLNIEVYVDDQLMAPLKAIGVSALVAVLLVLVALAIVLSVFGSVIFITLLVFSGIAMVMVGVFWPILLIAVVIWLVTSNSSKHAQE
jgi:hypothetical protein